MTLFQLSRAAILYSTTMVERLHAHWQVIVAALFSVALIAGSYVLARDVESPAVVEASMESALLQAVAAKDADNDGLSDWEEVLYGTDPNKTDSLKLGMTDGEAVMKGLIIPKAIADIKLATPAPTVASSINYAANGLTPPVEGTITDAFAKNFFTIYIAAKAANNGAELTSDQVSLLADQALNQFSQDLIPASDFKTAADITVSGTGPDSLRAFAVAAEAVLKKNATTATLSELGYLQAALEGASTSATTRLAALAKSYRDTAVGLAMLPVPQELVATDLAIINALMRLSEIDADFARVNTDPLAAMLALQQFSQAELAAERAFTELARVYAAAGVKFAAGAPGASFVNIMATVTARQAATK